MENMESYYNSAFNNISANTTTLVERAQVEMYRSNVVDHTAIKPRLILVIDDSATVRRIVGTCLQRVGFDVVGFPDGIEVMRWFTEPGAFVPDLVILDIGLPMMDGYEVARRLRAKPQLNQMVIIMLTRRNGTIDKLKARLAGAKDYLTKPFKTEELLSVIASHLPRGKED